MYKKSKDVHLRSSNQAHILSLLKPSAFAQNNNNNYDEEKHRK